MSPVPSVNNSTNGHRLNAELLRKFSPAGPTRRALLTYNYHLFFGQSGTWVRTAIKMFVSDLLLLIFAIIQRCPKKQMRGVDTEGRITVMANRQPLRDSTKRQAPDQSMCLILAMLIFRAAIGVGTLVASFGTRPQPAGTEVWTTFGNWPVFVNLGPKLLFSPDSTVIMSPQISRPFMSVAIPLDRLATSTTAQGRNISRLDRPTVPMPHNIPVRVSFNLLFAGIVGLAYIGLATTSALTITIGDFARKCACAILRLHRKRSPFVAMAPAVTSSAGPSCCLDYSTNELTGQRSDHATQPSS